MLSRDNLRVNRLQATVSRSLPKTLGAGKKGQALLGALALLLGTPALALANPHTLTASNPSMEIQGVSGGPSLVSDCSATLSEQPSQEIVLTESFVQTSGFLKFALKAPGSPVLVLDGPAGRFCSLGDSTSQQNPEVSGYWLPGVYRVYVGDRQQTNHPYTLSINKEQG